MRVAVTGASGNIGTSVLEALERDPEVDEVVGIARRRPEDWPGRTVWRVADVARDPLEPAFAGADAVIHLAWALNPSRNREEKRRVNVEGTRRALAAAKAAGVSAFVHASSIGVYAPAPKDRHVDESWPATGIPGFDYSEDKVAVERALAEAEREAGMPRIVRLRPTLVLKREAAAHLRRELVGPWLPSPLLRRGLIPFMPDNDRIVVQVAHASDIAEAFRLAVHADVSGPFNLGADPPLTARRIAELLGARLVPVPPRAIRRAHAAAFALRLVPSVPGWSDEALDSPIVSYERARRELGWEPKIAPEDALLETLDGIRTGAGAPTPPLDPSAGGPFRLREVLTGLGARGSN